MRSSIVGIRRVVAFQESFSTYAQIRTVSATLSFLHQLVTGIGGENWTEVHAELENYSPSDFAPPTKRLKAEIIPTCDNLKDAFTKGYDAACGVSFVLWVTGLLAAYCWSIWGSRSNVDLNSLKTSVVHDHNTNQDWASTSYDGGRNKLAGNKKGNRPWCCYFGCLCPGGKHIPVPEGFEWSLRPDGNPSVPITFPTECPLNCIELKRRRKVNGEWRLFSKWTKTTHNWVSNHGDVAKLAIDWFVWQGYEGPRFSRNAGRNALGRWLQETHAPYHEGFQVHGDLIDVWRTYQPGVPESKYAVRTQTTDPLIATAALRRLQRIFGRGRRSQVARAPLSLSDKLMIRFMENQGQALVVEQVVEEHQQEQQQAQN